MNVAAWLRDLGLEQYEQGPALGSLLRHAPRGSNNRDVNVPGVFLAEIRSASRDAISAMTFAGSLLVY
jgi:hypothetical protein